MEFSPLAFMELFVVLAFGIGWLILERGARRLDRKRQDERDEDTRPDDAAR
jgi:hypothetical protein